MHTSIHTHMLAHTRTQFSHTITYTQHTHTYAHTKTPHDALTWHMRLHYKRDIKNANKVV